MNKKIKILIVCKGGNKVGLGHLLRSRTFGRYASDFYNVKVAAIVDEGLENVFNEIKSRCKFFGEDKAVLSFAAEFKPDIIIFDLIDIEKRTFNSLKKLASLTVSISPVFSHCRNIDVLFTRSRHTQPLKGVKIFGGLEYAIFNDYCYQIDDETYFKSLSKKDLTIGISMGGTDAPNKTFGILKELSAISQPCTFWVLLGEGYAYSYNDLVNVMQKDKDHEIILAKTNRSMWNILGNCAVAVLAGGLTSVEAVYSGLPTINIFEKKEHVDAMAKELVEAGVCVNLGLYSNEAHAALKKSIERFIDKKSKLLEMRENTKGLVDKRGSERILNQIIRIYRNGN